MASVPLTLLATASQAALERSSSGRITTWLRTPTRPFSRRQPRKRKSGFARPRLPFDLLAIVSPALGLEILHVHVHADVRIGDHLADVFAVLDDGVARPERAQRYLVTDRNVLRGLERDGLVGLGDDAEHLGATLQPLDDDDADVVLRTVNQEVRLGHGFSPRVLATPRPRGWRCAAISSNLI